LWSCATPLQRYFTWSVFAAISEALDTPLVTYGQWVERLGDQLKSLSEEDLKDTPALKLLDVFRGVQLEQDAGTEAILPKVSVTIAVSESVNFANARELTPLDVKKWIGYWTSLGLL